MKKSRLSSAIRIATATAVLGFSPVALSAGGNIYGSIDGRIVDENDNEVKNVTITITNESNGFSKTISTGDDGDFKIKLPGGVYKLETSREGYESVTVETVQVSLGTPSNLVIPVKEGAIEEMMVLGTARSFIKTGTAESALNLSSEQVADLPIPRTPEAVALQAPGTVAGDSAFGDDKILVSFGGASAGENTYFIDGLNVTNFRNGLGGSSVPFEFYDQFQIKTGGYSAEFGRSLGGVINTTTKTGGNDFQYGVVSYFEPSALRETSPDSYDRAGGLYDLNNENSRSEFTTDLYVSGPIIRDKLFFYVLYEDSNTNEEFTSRGDTGTWNDRKIEDDFWGGSLLWNINSDHSLKYVAFTDKRTRANDQSNYDVDTLRKVSAKGVANEDRGGDNWMLNYNGTFFDNFHVSALWGENEYDLTDTATTDVDCPYVVDTSDGALPGNTSTFPGCEAASRVELGGDKRIAKRIDFEWELGDHTLAFGIDNEENTSSSVSTYSGLGFRDAGGVYYRYYTYAVGTELSNGGIVPDANGDGSDVHIVRYRLSEVAGDFEANASAYYIEDTWDISDSVTITAGLRNETFENLNGEGDVFIKMENQWAPRLSASWNPQDNTRIFAHWGRYFLPVATNTNVRLSGGELGTQQYFIFDGLYDDPSYAPTSRGAQGVPSTQEIGGIQVTANGETPDSVQLSDKNLDPMYQEEFILGFEKEIANDWLFGVKYVNRDLKSHIDDILIDEAVDALGYEHTGDAGGYVLANPGSDVTIPYDRYDTGTLEETTFSAADLGYDKAERKYNAFEFLLERQFIDGWGVRATYVWSESEGNTEGYVKSDNGQDDAGITQDFDEPKLMDGAYGYLPNDRTHAFKLLANYQATDNLLLGANFLMQSGRPINSFGTGHPDGTPIYGDTYYLENPDDDILEYRFTPRGSRGRTPWVTQIDLSAIYSIQWGSADIELRADIFNILDASSETEVYEFAELSDGIADPKWGTAQEYQTPRYVRFGASLRF